MYLFAAGSDLWLHDGPNRTIATLTFNRSHPSDSFNIQVPCDGLVEGLNQRCILIFGGVAIPESERDILNATLGAPAVLNIRECDDDCELCTIPVNIRILAFTWQYS